MHLSVCVNKAFSGSSLDFRGQALDYMVLQFDILDAFRGDILRGSYRWKVRIHYKVLAFQRLSALPTVAHDCVA
jgi:hypothetical protein